MRTLFLASVLAATAAAPAPEVRRLLQVHTEPQVHHIDEHVLHHDGLRRLTGVAVKHMDSVVLSEWRELMPSLQVTCAQNGQVQISGGDSEHWPYLASTLTEKRLLVLDNEASANCEGVMTSSELPFLRLTKVVENAGSSVAFEATPASFLEAFHALEIDATIEPNIQRGLEELNVAHHHDGRRLSVNSKSLAAAGVTAASESNARRLQTIPITQDTEGSFVINNYALGKGLNYNYNTATGKAADPRIVLLGDANKGLYCTDCFMYADAKINMKLSVCFGDELTTKPLFDALKNTNLCKNDVPPVGILYDFKGSIAKYINPSIKFMSASVIGKMGASFGLDFNGLNAAASIDKKLPQTDFGVYSFTISGIPVKVRVLGELGIKGSAEIAITGSAKTSASFIQPAVTLGGSYDGKASSVAMIKDFPAPQMNVVLPTFGEWGALTASGKLQLNLRPKITMKLYDVIPIVTTPVVTLDFNLAKNPKSSSTSSGSTTGTESTTTRLRALAAPATCDPNVYATKYNAASGLSIEAGIEEANVMKGVLDSIDSYATSVGQSVPSKIKDLLNLISITIPAMQAPTFTVTTPDSSNPLFSGCLKVGDNSAAAATAGADVKVGVAAAPIDPTAPSSSSTDVGAIVGGIIGALAGVALIVGGVLFYRKKKGYRNDMAYWKAKVTRKEVPPLKTKEAAPAPAIDGAAAPAAPAATPAATPAPASEAAKPEAAAEATRPAAPAAEPTAPAATAV